MIKPIIYILVFILLYIANVYYFNKHYDIVGAGAPAAVAAAAQ